MEVEELKNYINTLKEYESLLNEDKGDIETISDLNKFLKNLSSMVETTTTTSQSLEINVKRLHKDAVIPSYSKPGDAGLDLTVTELKAEDDKDITYGYGLAIEIPLGYVGLIFPRSSVKDYDLILSNCVGVIDSGYRGELMSTFKKTRKGEKLYKKGERAAQILIMPYPKIQLVEKNELTKTERNDGGFGHTGV